MSEQEPTFVKCLCRLCSGGIEFDSRGLDPEVPITVSCPHCGKDTELTFTTHRAAPVSKLKAARLTLTKQQLESDTGAALVKLLCELGADGVLTEDETRRLRNWTAVNLNCGIPAVPFLYAAADKLARRFSKNRVYELQLAMERVLPKLYRAEFKEKRQAAYLAMPEHQPTEKQLRFIADLGGKPYEGMTRFAASLLIEELLAERERHTVAAEAGSEQGNEGQSLKQVRASRPKGCAAVISFTLAASLLVCLTAVLLAFR